MLAFSFPKLAIKSFDKSRLKPVDPFEQSRAHILDASSEGETGDEEDLTDVTAAPPPRSKLMYRRHTVNVALSTADVSAICDLSRSREPSVSSVEGCSDD